MSTDLDEMRALLFRQNAIAFITESNSIEGIDRPPTNAEIECHLDFIEKEEIFIEDMEAFVSIYQPNAQLRSKTGLDVRIGNHFPPMGGVEVGYALNELLLDIKKYNPYEAHCIYETLHPFTDGNGRSGRVLWAWHTRQVENYRPREFLRQFYYQSLQMWRK